MVRQIRVLGRIAVSWRTVLIIAVTMMLVLEMVRWLRVLSIIAMSWWDGWDR